MNLTSVDARINLDLIDRSAPKIQGNAGRGRRWTANALRSLGLLGSASSAVLAVLAATNLWNPGGWVAAVLLGGLGLASWSATALGRRTRKGAEEQRVAARAKAVAEARTAVNGYYDRYETERLKGILVASWEGASPQLHGLLKEALDTRKGHAKIVKETAWLRGQANDQPPSPSPTDVIRRATDQILAQTSDWDPPTLDALLLGEDWVVDSTQAQVPEHLSERDRLRHASAANRDRAGFSAHLVRSIHTAGKPAIRRWLERASTSEFLDEQEKTGLDAAWALLDSPPNVVVLGDYSSGKTSLIKRLLADAGAETPTSLHVEAGPTRSAAQRYAFGQMVLVDSPGLQSGQDNHDAMALEASQDAALAIVVLHVNLLIGDTASLDQVILGDRTRVGKAARTVFVIGRIDEVGADPQTAARDFLRRRQRKVEELLRIFESRGLAVEPEQVLTLSADPHGLVGDHTPVSRADYASESRAWDGVGTLCQPLLALEGDRLADLSAGAALDRGRSALLAAQSRLMLDHADIGVAQAPPGRG